MESVCERRLRARRVRARPSARTAAGGPLRVGDAAARRGSCPKSSPGRAPGRQRRCRTSPCRSPFARPHPLCHHPLATPAAARAARPGACASAARRAQLMPLGGRRMRGAAILPCGSRAWARCADERITVPLEIGPGAGLRRGLFQGGKVCRNAHTSMLAAAPRRSKRGGLIARAHNKHINARGGRSGRRPRGPLRDNHYGGRSAAIFRAPASARARGARRAEKKCSTARARPARG